MVLMDVVLQPACPKNWTMRRRVGITVSVGLAAPSHSRPYLLTLRRPVLNGSNY